MALNKSKDLKTLLYHLSQIAWPMLLVLGVIKVPAAIALIFVGLYCLIHGVQDWFIWRGYGWYVIHRRFREVTRTAMADKEYLRNRYLPFWIKEKKYAEDKAFYDTIGLDRLIHVVTLVVLYGIFFL